MSTFPGRNIEIHWNAGGTPCYAGEPSAGSPALARRICIVGVAISAAGEWRLAMSATRKSCSGSLALTGKRNRIPWHAAVRGFRKVVYQDHHRRMVAIGNRNRPLAGLSRHRRGTTSLGSQRKQKHRKHKSEGQTEHDLSPNGCVQPRHQAPAGAVGQEVGTLFSTNISTKRIGARISPRVVAIA
jgi:hypothetical protein